MPKLGRFVADESQNVVRFALQQKKIEKFGFKLICQSLDPPLTSGYELPLRYKCEEAGNCGKRPVLYEYKAGKI